MKKSITQREISLMILFTLFFALTGYFVKAQDVEITVIKKSYNGADESCRNANDAELTINATGGTGVYQYSIDNGSHYYSNNVFSGLTTGQNYQVLAKDNSGKNPILYIFT